jgi:hypothetical protein
MNRVAKVSAHHRCKTATVAVELWLTKSAILTTFDANLRRRVLYYGTYYIVVHTTTKLINHPVYELFRI